MLIRNKRAISAILHQLALAAFVYLYADGGWGTALWFAGLQVPFGITALLVLTRTGNDTHGAGRSGRSMEVFRVWLVPIVLAAGVLYLLDLTAGDQSPGEGDAIAALDLDGVEQSEYAYVAPEESGVMAQGSRVGGFVRSLVPDPVKVGIVAAALGFLHLWVLLLSGPDGARTGLRAEAPAPAEADPLAGLDLA